MNAGEAYVRLFNFMIRRVVAVGFILVGSILTVWTIQILLDPSGTIRVEGVAESNILIRLMTVLLSAMVVVLGVGLFRIKPFDPSRNDGGYGDSDT